MPLLTDLSQVLLAYAIEFDNEFERRMSEISAKPLRVSIVMWSNFLRFVPPEGTTVADMESVSAISRLAPTLGGLERWGYITIDNDPRRKDFGSGRGIRSATTVHPTKIATAALERWDGLADEIEKRWRVRFGDHVVDHLRDALRAHLAGVDLVLPHFLPIIGGGTGLFAEIVPAGGTSAPDDDLPALLARVLLALTLDFERESKVSLAAGSNVLRVVDNEGVRVADLPMRTGVAKEAVAFSSTWLSGAGLVTVEADPSARGKVMRLTEKGARAQSGFARRVDDIRGGDDLRASLRAVLEQPNLGEGMIAPDGCWRGTKPYKRQSEAFVSDPVGALPHYPMVLHRGGWPDGS